MASQISNKKLLEKVRELLLNEQGDHSLDVMIKDAIISTDRELHDDVDLEYPLAWDIIPYDIYRTVPYANISAITAADPGVVTAASSDSDITGHGFHNHSTVRDIVVIDGIEGMDELNTRTCLLEYIDSTTFSLKTLEGLDDVDTSGYDAYGSGGQIYHTGLVLNTTAILANVATKWTFKKVCHPGPTFDGYPTKLISEHEANSERHWRDVSYGQRPARWRYWKNMTDASTTAHYLFWYPVANTEYNIRFSYQKEVPDITAWTSSTYTFHPAEIHEVLWHGAIAKLIGASQRMQRQGNENGFMNTRMERLFAQNWIGKYEEDKYRVIRMSRKLLGVIGNTGNFSG